MWDNSVVTNAGATLLAAWAGGGVLTITRASAGDQTAPVAQLVNLTALTHEVEDLGITESRVVDGGVRYRVQFDAAQSAYTAKQIGVWGKLGSGAETLIAVYQDEDGIDVPAASDIPDYLFAFFATIQMDNTGELQVTLDTTALVSQAEMAAAIQAGVNAILPVSVQNGGTGQTDAAAALQALGGVAKTGDTMTGTLIIERNLYPIVVLRPTQAGQNNRAVFEGSYQGAASFSAYEDANGTNRRMIEVRSKTRESSLDRAVMVRQGIDGNISDYRVFHEGMETPVPVANGGTGASDAAGARANLNIRSGRVTGVSLAAGAQDSSQVTFSSAMPSNQYVVVVTIYGSFSAAANVRYSTGGQTASGFTMRYMNTGSSDQSGLIFDWVAVAI